MILKSAAILLSAWTRNFQRDADDQKLEKEQFNSSWQSKFAYVASVINYLGAIKLYVKLGLSLIYKIGSDSRLIAGYCRGYISGGLMGL